MDSIRAALFLRSQHLALKTATSFSPSFAAISGRCKYLACGSVSRNLLLDVEITAMLLLVSDLIVHEIERISGHW